MEKLYRQVRCKDENPKKDDYFDTDKGVLAYNGVFQEWFDSAEDREYPTLWYEEVTTENVGTVKFSGKLKPAPHEEEDIPDTISTDPKQELLKEILLDIEKLMEYRWPKELIEKINKL